jgi:hypothetical protein
MHFHRALPRHQRPDRNAGVEVAGEVQIGHGTGIGSASHRLEFIEDLHGANLRRPGHRAGGECRLQGRQRVHVFTHTTGHPGDQVHHVGVTLHVGIAIDANRAGARHATEIVATEIDEHQVFGVLLGVGAQFPFESLVRRGIGPAPPGAGDRMGLDLATGTAHQCLR